MEYELMFLIAEKDNQNFDKIKEGVKKLVETAGGTWTGESVEFERKLAYEIKHNWRGTYFVQRFTVPNKDEREENLADGETSKNIVGEVTRQMNLRTDILRYIIVNAKELPSLESFAKQGAKEEKDSKKTLKEKGEKIDGKLEEALNI
ncbi:MAG: 30S ribosomal protein S6 [Patescibacteria group bacterium]